MVVADLNGDGHTDLVIQSIMSGSADVFLGSTNGLLTAAGSYAGSSPVQSMLLHDVDGDGHPDLILEGVRRDDRDSPRERGWELCRGLRGWDWRCGRHDGDGAAIWSQ